MTGYKLIQLAPGSYDVLLDGEIIASLVRSGPTQAATWTAELLVDLSPEERPAPFTEAEHQFGAFDEARAWLGDPHVQGEGIKRPRAGAIITPAQCLEARALLGWSRDHLAPLCGLSPTTLLRFETGARFPKSEDIAAIQQALEAAGVEFTNGEPGVKLRKQP
jgi:DNA-binding XRE family transcriptional regulator